MITALAVHPAGHDADVVETVVATVTDRHRVVVDLIGFTIPLGEELGEPVVEREFGVYLFAGEAVEEFLGG